LDALRLAGEPELVAPMNAGSAQITLSGVTLAEVAGGGFYGLPFMALPALDLTFEGVTIDADDTAVFLISTQDIALQDVDAAGMSSSSSPTSGRCRCRFEPVAGTDSRAPGRVGIAVDASTVRAADGAIVVIGAYTSLGRRCAGRRTDHDHRQHHRGSRRRLR
jgi:hypothetical protein